MADADAQDHVGLEFGLAVRAGDLQLVRRMIEAHPGLASVPIRALGSRTPLHVAADWPGYFPNGSEMVRLLVSAGAHPDGNRGDGFEGETPLHWAASTDDVEVAAALLDAGADIEAPGASIAGGGPLGNAVGYGCWHVARLLVERGARVEKLWQAAALGMTEKVKELLSGSPGPTANEINEAFWQACHGGQRRIAELLLAQAADINAHPGYAEQTPVEIAGSPDTRRDLLVGWLRENGASGD